MAGLMQASRLGLSCATRQQDSGIVEKRNIPDATASPFLFSRLGKQERGQCLASGSFCNFIGCILFSINNQIRGMNMFGKPHLGKKVLTGLFLASLVGPIFAQASYTASGVVVDATDNQPLPGASVVVKGTRVATQAGQNGQFAINVPAAANSLVISSTGYQTTEVSARSANKIKVALRPE